MVSIHKKSTLINQIFLFMAKKNEAQINQDMRRII